MWALVPYKLRTRAKRRLAGHLSSSQRAGLSRSMLEDLLASLVKAGRLNGVLIVSDDPLASRLSAQYGIEALAEGRGRNKGINAALQHASSHLELRGVTELMVIHGDLPLARSPDLGKLIRNWETHSENPALTLVPDRHNSGTNCLISPLPCPISFCFGPDSLARHQDLAMERGIPVYIARPPSLMFDIDTPDDLAELARRLATGSHPDAPKTQRFLSTLDIDLTGQHETPASTPGWALNTKISPS